MNTPSQPSSAPVRHTNRTLWLILFICLLPPALAYILSVTRPSWMPRAETNNGELIQPTQAVPALALHDASGSPLTANAFKGHWSLIVLGRASCDANCLQRVVEIRNIRALLRDQSQRLQVFYLAPNAGALSHIATDMGTQRGGLKLLSEGEGVGQSASDFFKRVPGSVVMLDPLSNWVLAYKPSATPKEIYIDLKRLLRYSHIG